MKRNLTILGSHSEGNRMPGLGASFPHDISCEQAVAPEICRGRSVRVQVASGVEGLQELCKEVGTQRPAGLHHLCV